MRAYVVEQANGVWSTAQTIPGVTGSDLASVSCPAPGACVAGGAYVKNGAQLGFVVEQSHGSWSGAQAIPGLSGLGKAGVDRVSCSSIGNCSAAGGFTGTAGPNDRQEFVATETRSHWGSARPIPGLTRLNLGEDAVVSSLSCGLGGRCILGGTYLRNRGGDHFAAFVALSIDGAWRPAQRIPGLDAIDPGHNSNVESVSCEPSGDCAAVGGFSGKGAGSAFLVNEVAGKWGRAEAVPGLSLDELFQSEAVSCASQGCTAVGDGMYGFDVVAPHL